MKDFYIFKYLIFKIALLKNNLILGKNIIDSLI